jgi:hypothetical protein
VKIKSIFSNKNLLIVGALFISGLFIFGAFYFIQNYNLVVVKLVPEFNPKVVDLPPSLADTSTFEGVATSTKLRMDKFINSFPITSFDDLDSGLLILKEERMETKGNLGNYYNNSVFYFSVLNIETETEQKIVIASTRPWIAKSKLIGDKIYFINDESKINYFDIPTKNTVQLKFPENSSINDFYISGHLIFYLKNGCSERMSYVLGVYDNASKQNKIILDKLETSPVGSVVMSEYLPNKNAILLIYAMGDTGVATVSLSKIDIETGKEEILHNVKFEYCGEYGEACTDVQKKRNDVYDAFKKKYLDKINYCGDATIMGGYGKKGRYVSINIEKKKLF